MNDYKTKVFLNDGLYLAKLTKALMFEIKVVYFSFTISYLMFGNKKKAIPEMIELHPKIMK